MSSEPRPDDKELEDFLAGRHPLGRAYREAAQHQGAPPELDADILAAARAEAGRPLPRRRPRWMQPLAFAATLTLGLVVLLQLRHQGGVGTPLEAPLRSQALQGPASERPIASPLPAPPAPKSSPLPAPASRDESERSGAIPEAAAEQAAPPATMRSEPSSAASAPARTRESEAPEDSDARDSSAAEAVDANANANANADADADADAGSGSGSGSGAALKGSVTASPASPSSKAERAPEASSSSQPAGVSPPAGQAERPAAMEGSAGPAVRKAPGSNPAPPEAQAMIEAMREHLETQNQDAAREVLRVFRRQYPHLSLPVDLQELEAPYPE